jgi:RHS repeat-associated protein
MRGTTCCEQDASLAIIRRALRFERIVPNADVATTTYAYDANGNLIQAGGWNYVWDYLNRMLSSGFNNSTTTYAYDEFGSRVMQTSTTSTTYYPNKYFSTVSNIVGGTTYATSTNYIWNGDTLLATIDQKLINGTATGTPITRYIHPDHLGSTDAVTDQNGALVQLLDYYPYGATRVSTSSYPTNEKRQFIGQYSDTSGLSYLNARYYSPTQGQFLSEDPVFWGDPKQQNLLDPQTFNLYSYANDNPITKSDPTGRQFCEDACIGEIIFARAMQWAIPVIRTGLTTGLVSADAQIGSNLYQQATGNGQNTMTVGSLGNAFGQGFAFGATAETGAGFVSPLAAPFFRTAKAAKLFGQTVSAGGVTVGVDTVNGNSNPWQITGDAAFSMMSTYGATRIVGVPRGSDVKSFSSPAFFNGSQMSNASRNAVVSQGIQSALTSLVSALQGLLVSLQSQQSSSKSK